MPAGSSRLLETFLDQDLANDRAVGEDTRTEYRSSRPSQKPQKPVAKHQSQEYARPMTPLQLGFYERLLTILRQLRRPRRQSRKTNGHALSD